MPQISHKRAIKLKDNDINRVVQDIYGAINELIDSVNSSQVSLGETVKGKTGDLRIVKIAENDYRFEIRTDEGWAKSSGFTLVSKDD